MATRVFGFVEVTATGGRTFYISPHHVAAIEASVGIFLHLHHDEKIPITETAEDFLETLEVLKAVFSRMASSTSRWPRIPPGADYGGALKSCW